MEKSFEGQREGEVAKAIVRHHPLMMRKGLYLWLVLILLGAVPLLISPLNPNMLWIFLGAVGLGALGFFWFWIGWYFTVYIITDQRIRLVTQRGLFAKSVIELPLSKVQNISFQIPGLSGELFKYGTIVLQTIVGDMVMDQIAFPERVYNIIQDTLVNVESEEYDGE